MKMRNYVLKRLFYSIFVLLGLSVVIFGLSRVVPGDPARLALGAGAPEWAVEQLKNKLHLNEPLPVQYFIWLTNALRGDLGESLVTKRPVVQDFFSLFPATVELVLFATIVSIVISVPIGALAGRRANGYFDNATRIFSYIGIAVPNFVWAIVLLLLFGYLWKIFPLLGALSTGVLRPPTVTGFLSIDAILAGNLTAFIDHLRHLVLPGACMAVATIAQDAKLLRAGVVENLKKDYITSAVSHGIPERKIIGVYLLKPSLIPVVSIMGMEIASALAGSFVIETIFNWPGFGRYAMWAMLNKDLNAIVASVMLIGFFFAILNIVIDVLVAYLDPRIRMVEKTK